MSNSILYLGAISEPKKLKAILGRLAAMDLSLDRASAGIAEIVATLPKAMDHLDAALSRLPEGENSSKYRYELIELRAELEKVLEQAQNLRVSKSV